MRFLVDNSLSPIVAERLREAGYDAIHVRHIQMQAATDESIFEYADSDERTIIAADTDFGTLLALWEKPKPSVILFRRGTQKSPEHQIQLLLANLPIIKASLLTGSVIVFERNRLRIRSLPIGS